MALYIRRIRLRSYVFFLLILWLTFFSLCMSLYRSRSYIVTYGIYHKAPTVFGMRDLWSWPRARGFESLRWTWRKIKTNFLLNAWHKELIFLFIKNERLLIGSVGWLLAPNICATRFLRTPPWNLYISWDMSVWSVSLLRLDPKK